MGGGVLLFHKTVSLRVSDFDACKLAKGQREEREGVSVVQVGAGKCDFTATVFPPPLSSQASSPSPSPPPSHSGAIAERVRREIGEVKRRGPGEQHC